MRRSSLNNLQHGLLARTVVLEDENIQSFTDLLTAYQRHLDPKTKFSETWSKTWPSPAGDSCAYGPSKAPTFKIEIDKHDPGANSPATRAAMAFRTLADESHSLDLLNRYETRFDRQYAAPSLSSTEFCNPELIPNSDT